MDNYSLYNEINKENLIQTFKLTPQVQELLVPSFKVLKSSEVDEWLILFEDMSCAITFSVEFSAPIHDIVLRTEYLGKAELASLQSWREWVKENERLLLPSLSPEIYRLAMYMYLEGGGDINKLGTPLYKRVYSNTLQEARQKTVELVAQKGKVENDFYRYKRGSCVCLSSNDK